MLWQSGIPGNWIRLGLVSVAKKQTLFQHGRNRIVKGGSLLKSACARCEQPFELGLDQNARRHPY